MTNRRWPDALALPQPVRVSQLLSDFWQNLAQLPDLLNRQEHLLAETMTCDLRQIVLEMMLALNGIGWPDGTRHLNSYLGESQRAALQRTLLLPDVSAESWVGRAVALVVIYRWYAPQLTAKFALTYPQALEAETLAHLQQHLPDWPLAITTD